MNAKLMKNMKKKKKGFTLVELIIVIAIIAILAAMALPKFGAVRKDARISNDVAAAKNIQSATSILVSNGTVAENDSFSVVSSDTKGKAVIDRLDGQTAPKAQSGTATTTFDVKVKDGTVTVKSSAADTQLAPADDSTEKNYKTALEGSGSGSGTGSGSGSGTGTNP